MAFSTINCQNYYKSGATRDAKKQYITENYGFYVFVKRLQKN